MPGISSSADFTACLDRELAVEGYAKAVGFVAQPLQELEGGVVVAKDNGSGLSGQKNFFYAFCEADYRNCKLEVVSCKYFEGGVSWPLPPSITIKSGSGHLELEFGIRNLSGFRFRFRISRRPGFSPAFGASISFIMAKSSGVVLPRILNLRYWDLAGSRP